MSACTASAVEGQELLKARDAPHLATPRPLAGHGSWHGETTFERDAPLPSRLSAEPCYIHRDVIWPGKRCSGLSPPPRTMCPKTRRTRHRAPPAPEGQRTCAANPGAKRHGIETPSLARAGPAVPSRQRAPRCAQLRREPRTARNYWGRWTGGSSRPTRVPTALGPVKTSAKRRRRVQSSDDPEAAWRDKLHRHLGPMRVTTGESTNQESGTPA